MKKMVFTILAAIVATSFLAQQPLCPVKEGVVLTYASKNAKGKVTSYSRQEVTSVTGSGNNLTITYSGESLDAKKKPTANVPAISYSYKVENGTVIIDAKALLNGITTGSPTDGPAEGNSMILPANMKAGDKLPDCDIKMWLAFVRISAIYTNGLCEGEETITTEAGTFTCVKTKYNCKSSVMGIKSDMIIDTWYAPGIGTVKQEIYIKGKLNSTQELVELGA
jgi:hypothetical protein